MPAIPGRFSGVVLCGGSSTRMGRDKASVVVDGLPMARRVADVLQAAGAAQVLAVGGDADALELIGLTAHPDDVPGAGPLPATITALRVALEDAVVVMACDLVQPDVRAVTRLLDALHTDAQAVVAVAVTDGHRQWTHAAWRRAAGAALADAHAQGARSLRRAGGSLPLVEVTDLDPRWFADADTPADLPPLRRAPSDGK